MPARRSLAHDGGWSSIALHLAPADGSKDGFYLTLFSEARPPQVVFLTPRQVEHLIELAENTIHSDLAVWDYVAKIPLEPLLPNRSMGARLRWMLTDSAASIRAEARAQLDRRPPPPTPAEDEAPNSIEAPAPKFS